PANSLEDGAYFVGDPGFAIPEEPAGVIDERQITAEGESLEHTLTFGIERASIFDRAEPDGFLQVSRRLRAGHAVVGGGRELFDAAVRSHVLDARPDRRVRAGLWKLHNSRGHWIQIDVRARRKQRFFVENRDAFVALLEERAAHVVLAIRDSG